MAAKFPPEDKKLTKGLDFVSFVLANEGDTLEGTYAGSTTRKGRNGKPFAVHLFVTEDGLATVFSRKQIDSFLTGKRIKPGDTVSIERKKNREFTTPDGDDRVMHVFKCEKT